MSGSVHVNYHVKSGVGTPDDKFEVNAHRTGKGFHIVAFAGIPGDVNLDAFEAAFAPLAEFDDADVSLEKHKELLVSIRSALDELIQTLP